MSRLSLRHRITGLVAVAVALAVALVSLAAYLTVRHQLHAQLDANLLGRAQAAAQTQLAETDFLVRVPSAAYVAGDVSIALLTGDGTLFAPPGGPAPPVGTAELAVAQGRAARALRSEAGQRVAAVPVRPGLALVLGQPLGPTERALRTLGLVLLLVSGLGVGAAAVTGLVVARAGVAPVQRLTAAAERVARTEDLQPIAVTGHDELARLAVAFNAMLAALAAARARQRRLVADAGHELRTPLTSLRTNLDLLAQSDAAGPGGLAAADRAALLGDVRAQLGELTGLVDDLVELSREGPPAAAAEPVDLAAVTERAVDRVRRRAPGVRFTTDLQPWVVHGDPNTLERAVTNVLDNAAKWSPPQGTVTVGLRGGRLEVTDEGPGIDEADLPHVFERFYRAADARALPGSGLGLAIVAQAVARHGGTVEAQRAPRGGTRVVLTLPGAPDRAVTDGA